MGHCLLWKVQIGVGTRIHWPCWLRIHDSEVSYEYQCCGSVPNDLLRFRFLIWKRFVSGSGSISVSRLICTDFQQHKKFVKNLAFSMLEAALLPRKLASNFWFFYFFIKFCVGSGSKSGFGTGLHYGFGCTKAKSCGSGSFSKTLMNMCWKSPL